MTTNSIELINSLLNFLSIIDPLSLAVIFLGLISLGVIWLASTAIKALLKGK